MNIHFLGGHPPSGCAGQPSSADGADELARDRGSTDVVRKT